jgi:NAD(P)-dependent dehydrogenase (short-subunit alcohol dehydrogenase family)
MEARKRWSEADIPDQRGKTAVVTGANSGIGFRTALELARAGSRVVLTARDREKGARAIVRLQDEVPEAAAEIGVLDLADLASVRRFAQEVLDRHGGIDVLVNNAGVMAVPRRRTTADGFELQLGTNHLGHFALSGLLMPGLAARPGARVVTVGSLMHRIGRIAFEDLQAERRYDPWSAYARSKLANLLFAFELDRRARDAEVSLLSVAAHPGTSATNLQTAGPRLGGPTLWTRIGAAMMRPIRQPARRGALPSLYAATARDVTGGAYYGPDGPGGTRGFPVRVEPARRALDEETARRLWAVSEELTGVGFEQAIDRAEAA